MENMEGMDMDHMHHDHATTETVPMVEGGHASHSMGGDMKMDMGHGMGHAMSFHLGSKEIVLFDFWHVMQPTGILISCVVIIAMCFIMEATRWFRAKREAVERAAKAQQEIVQKPTISPHRIVDALLHAVQLTLSYLLMLVFMTFNVWLCASVVIGEVVARFLLAVFKPVEVGPDNTNECCK